MSITINSEKRDELLNTKVDYTVSTTDNDFINKVGITDTFKIHITRSITDYCDNIRSAINKLDDLDTNVVFKGTSVEEQIKKFIDSIKQVSNSYINRLQDAEEQIIDGVYKAYTVQDIDLSSNIKADSNNIE